LSGSFRSGFAMCAMCLFGGRFALGHGTASYWLRGKEAPTGETGLLSVPLGGTAMGRELPSAAVVIYAVHNEVKPIIVHCTNLGRASSQQARARGAESAAMTGCRNFRSPLFRRDRREHAQGTHDRGGLRGKSQLGARRPWSLDLRKRIVGAARLSFEIRALLNGKALVEDVPFDMRWRLERNAQTFD